MMAFILATDFDFIAYMSKMAFFFWGGGGGGGKFYSRQWRVWNMIILTALGVGHSKQRIDHKLEPD